MKIKGTNQRKEEVSEEGRKAEGKKVTNFNWDTDLDSHSSVKSIRVEISIEVLYLQ